MSSRIDLTDRFLLQFAFGGALGGCILLVLFIFPVRSFYEGCSLVLRLNCLLRISSKRALVTA